MRRSLVLFTASLMCLARPARADETPGPNPAPAPAPIPPPPPPPTPAAPTSPAAPANPSRPPAPVAPSSRLDDVRKYHNYDLGGGSLGVMLTVPATVVGLAGETVAVVVWFYDAAGNPVRSNVPGRGDATNHLRVVSEDFVPTTSHADADFTFKVPYAAFPRTREGRHAVEARAVLVRRVGNGRTVLARRSTTFFVE